MQVQVVISISMFKKWQQNRKSSVG